MRGYNYYFEGYIERLFIQNLSTTLILYNRIVTISIYLLFADGVNSCVSLKDIYSFTK
ncbi:hypothetical protein HLPCO_002816 [Haloplasma contractile SSD-17B]|uniref:Uncharacterized protein n=1 Tax=Haloplasma contractile SSD-17B TaxID=1033810 RepID=U2E8D4_9MOLU|nr:hypothetical protein HLPCO_002816 [Haloplasma contractile SSD-17B]